MQLSKSNIKNIVPQKDLLLPSRRELDLPEKVLQFGTGVLLRGLPDHFITAANAQQVFNGRIVVVKSTATGDTDAFEKQDGLYTLCVRGVEAGEKIAFNQVVSSISRVLTASADWDEVLKCAADPAMELIISNTTEVGIIMEKDNVHASPPQSFPGKLLAFLYHRYKIFNGAEDKGMVIVPTELIPGNADKLLSIVLEQAHIHGLEVGFIDWLENSNHFCNSLVDRIVPGKFSEQEQVHMKNTLGYTDELMIMSESYALWVIQTDSDRVRSILSFADCNKEIILTPDIEKFRELKIRLLNGSHTFTCGLALLAGFTTVKEAMADDAFATFINRLMNEEFADAIECNNITKAEAVAFAGKVLDRYRNPFIEHQWLSICMNYSSKMHMRNVPLLYAYESKKSSVPALMSLGLAAHIVFMRSQQKDDGSFYGTVNGVPYKISDGNAAWYQQAWEQEGSAKIVEVVLANKLIWQTDLNEIKGLNGEVNYWLKQLLEHGAKATLENIQTKISI